MAKHGIFNNPIEPRTHKQGKYFAQPSYDEKKRMMIAGENYGTGFVNPRGKMRSEYSTDSIVPRGRIHNPPKKLG